MFIRILTAVCTAILLCSCAGAPDTEQDRADNLHADAESPNLGQVQQGLTEATAKIFGDGTGTIYATTTDGDLLWFKDLARNGGVNWAANSGNRIGISWNNFKFIFSGGDNIIYAVHNNGALYFYRDNANNGTWGWDAASGNVIGSGWGYFQYVFGDYYGGIYGVSTDGTLRRYQHTGRTSGTFSWTSNSGQIINSSNDYFVEPCWPSTILASSTMVGAGLKSFYRVTSSGNLLFHIDDYASYGTCGSFAAWSNWSGGYTNMLTEGGGGIIYAIGIDGNLRWLKNTTERAVSGYDPMYGYPQYVNPSFAPASGTVIRNGFASLHYP